MRYCSQCGAELPGPPPVTCAACAATHWRNAKPCAGALVTRDGCLLLIRRTIEPWQGRWDIPGGFSEHDEHPADTAVREVREETGFDVEITGFLGIWLDDYPDPAGGPPAVTLNIYYHAEAGPGEGRADPEEASELAWFAPEELPDDISFPDHALAVLSAWRQAMADGATRGPRYDRA